MPLPSITFAGTMTDIQQQMLDFLGLTSAQYADALAGKTHVAPPDAPASGGGGLPPLPANAPAGAYWIKSLGAPSLRGPDGAVLAVDWTQTHSTWISATRTRSCTPRSGCGAIR